MRHTGRVRAFEVKFIALALGIFSSTPVYSQQASPRIPEKCHATLDGLFRNAGLGSYPRPASESRPESKESLGIRQHMIMGQSVWSSPAADDYPRLPPESSTQYVVPRYTQELMVAYKDLLAADIKQNGPDELKHDSRRRKEYILKEILEEVSYCGNARVEGKVPEVAMLTVSAKPDDIVVVPSGCRFDRRHLNKNYPQNAKLVFHLNPKAEKCGLSHIEYYNSGHPATKPGVPYLLSANNCAGGKFANSRPRSAPSEDMQAPDADAFYRHAAELCETYGASMRINDPLRDIADPRRRVAKNGKTKDVREAK